MPIELKVPSVGESISEVYIGEWRKAEGEAVEVDEDVVELESEKATFEAPAPVAGVISQILKKSGETAEVGEVIAYIEEGAAGDGQSQKKQESPQKKEPQSDQSVNQAEEKPKKTEPAGRDRSATDRVMPAARRLLKEQQIADDEVEATGPGGRLLKEDVVRHQNESSDSSPRPQRTPANAGQDRSEELVRVSPLRRRIAERLVQAQQQAALLTTFNEADMAAIKELRASYQDSFVKKYDTKLGYMSFFVKAVVEALKEFPAVNAEYRGDQIAYRNYYDIGVAVGGGKGLVVPVLRNAERMSFAEIELTINDFAARAKSGTLNPEELQGGTFTISNGGVYGSLLSTPIVNPPQSGVLGMHNIVDRPVVVDGEIVIRPMMYLALTYDHRIVDGREAVTFLRRIKQVLETPTRMLLEV